MHKNLAWEKQINILSEKENEVTEEAVSLFANSKLPNSFFVKQFTDIGKYPFCEKQYWRAFALVLIKRGVENVKDIYNQLLIWLQDINNPGAVEISRFVTQNFTKFHFAIKETILQAINKLDDAWANTLFTIIYQAKGLSEIDINKNLKMTSDWFNAMNYQALLHYVVQLLQ